MSTIGDAKDGLVARLQTVSGLHVFVASPESVNEFPAAVVSVPDLQYHNALAANTLRHLLRVLLLLSHPGSNTEGWSELDSYLSPTGAKSIRAAVEGDRTLNGKVDDAEVTSARKIGPLELQGSTYLSAEFSVEYVVSVA